MLWLWVLVTVVVRRDNDMAVRLLAAHVLCCTVDIAVEASQYTAALFESTRSGAWVSPRIAFGAPVDHFGNTRAVWAIPHRIRAALFERVNRLMNGDLGQYGEFCCRCPGTAVHMRMVVWLVMDVATAGLAPKHGLFNAHPTLNGHLLDRIVTGHVRVKPNIDHLEETAVVFDDGTREEVDVLMYERHLRVGWCSIAHATCVQIRDGLSHRVSFPGCKLRDRGLT